MHTTIKSLIATLNQIADLAETTGQHAIYQLAVEAVANYGDDTDNQRSLFAEVN